MKIVHIITGVGVGGAETMLWKLISRSPEPGVDHHVISLTGDGPIGERLRSIGIPLHLAGMTMSPMMPIRLIQLSRLLKRIRPDVVQTWMYHSDLLGGIAARLAGISRIVWNIRASRLDAAGVGRGTMIVIHACARLSRWLPAKIISCSNASERVHSQLGYEKSKLITIPNGFDLSQFRPDPTMRLAVRAELELLPQALLIGLVGRFDPLKGHKLFVKAAGLLLRKHPEAHFVLCGSGVDLDNEELKGWIEEFAAGPAWHLLGYRSDVARLQAAFDIATCASSTEGFPNVVGEAMACGVPCVVTDVGDSAYIVGDTGTVVPPGDPEALADAWRRMIELGPEKRRALGEQARRRIESEFELSVVVQRYLELYRELCA